MQDGTSGGHPSSGRTRNARTDGQASVGLFVERVETKDTTDAAADDIEAQIKARLGLSESGGGAGKKGGVYCPTQTGEMGL
jgi:hypothetical protein